MKSSRENKGISIETLETLTGISKDKLQEFFDQIKASEFETISKALEVPLVVLMK